LHKIEQELNTEIRPIPKSIDKGLYVAEFQQVENEEQVVDATQEESRREK
jgi:ATP-dependent RNA helicase DDX6/DHH1